MKKIVKEVKNKRLKPNGRSADFTSPSFIWGCAGGCNFCYVYRNNPDNIYVANNVHYILIDIKNQIKLLPSKVSNQCGDKWSIDISCNTDIGLHFKQLDWYKVFEFCDENNITGTFATKYVRKEIEEYQTKNMRLRYSMLPNKYQELLFPDLSTLEKKIESANKLVENGWELHWNFSPVIVEPYGSKHYIEMFKTIDKHSSDKLKQQVKCEVIFLTHNEKLHNYNIQQGYTEEEKLLWVPEYQESKISQYGGKNVRYKYQLKNKLVNQFKDLLSEHLPYCKIRYIF